MLQLVSNGGFHLKTILPVSVFLLLMNQNTIAIANFFYLIDSWSNDKAIPDSLIYIQANLG
jgi:hypothetical protein